MVKLWQVRASISSWAQRWLSGQDRYEHAGLPSRAGPSISPETARTIGVVYRCISILANTLAMLPKHMYERLLDGRRPAPEHPLDPLISFRPNRRQTGFEFWRQIFHHLVLRSNAYIRIVQGSSGRGWVGELIPLNPDRIRGPEELSSGRLRYEYWKPNGEKEQLIGGLDLWHLQGLSDDGLRGLSMVDLAADSMGLSLASERHASRFFERGVKPAGILHSDKRYEREVAEAMGDSFTRKYGGEMGNASTPVLWDGMKFEPIAMNLKDAEFLDSRKFSVSEIARWFGVPPHMVGDVERSTSWGTGIEQQGLHFLVYSLQPWIELIEQSIRYTLVVQADRYYAKCNTQAILRMDSKTQAEVFRIYIGIGVMNPNEARQLLELNPRPGGDEYKDLASTPMVSAPEEPEEPEEEPEPEGEAQISLPAGLLEEERNGVVRLAKRHAKSSDRWRAALAGYYGQFARRIEATGLCSLEQAREYSAARREHWATVGIDGDSANVDR